MSKNKSNSKPAGNTEMTQEQPKESTEKVETPKDEPVQKVVKIPKKYVFKAMDLIREDKVILREHVYVPEGFELEDILHPESWQHIAHRLQAGTRISVTDNKFRFVAELIVVSCTQISAQVQLLWKKDIEANNAGQSLSSHYADFIGMKERYGIKRKSDGAIVESGFATEQEALAAISNLAKDTRSA